MKRNLIIYLLAICSLCACHDNSGLYGLLNDYDYRITLLEQKCDKLNTNIAALQTIIDALQTGDYITSVTPITSGGDEIGYTITFGNHESITIYNGQNGVDGKDGADGRNGQDGYNGQTPIIGVAQDIDGIYYWTLDGKWLLDDNGNKLRVTGQDGKDGRDGADGQNGHDGTDGQNGQDGANGTNGVNGVTPQLKIEDDYWYISYDNGATWTMVGKATGDDGKDGKDGKDGMDGVNGANGTNGDSMFESVTIDDNFVYFTLANGTTITVARTNKTIIKDGAIQAEFSVSPTKKVYFSMGNLQYRASTNTWRFAEHQWDVIGEDNMNMSPTYDGWIDLFAWGSSGYDSRIPPYCDTLLSTILTQDITNTNYDWGVYNPISNGGNKAGQWRNMTYEEFSYLWSSRPNASILRFTAVVDGKKGWVFLPDNWSTLYFPNYSEDNILLLSQWEEMLAPAGAVFWSLETGNIGRGWSYYHDYVNTYSHYGREYQTGSDYWSTSYKGSISTQLWNNQTGESSYAYPLGTGYYVVAHNGLAVRLVQDVP